MENQFYMHYAIVMGITMASYSALSSRRQLSIGSWLDSPGCIAQIVSYRQNFIEYKYKEVVVHVTEAHGDVNKFDGIATS